MNTTRKIGSALTASLLAAMLLASCGGTPTSTSSGSSATTASTQTSSTTSSDTETNATPTPLTILSPDDGRVVKEDNPVWAELEKRTNTELQLMLLPGNELTSKINTMAASGGLPDIIKYKDFFPYAEEGIMLDIGDLVEQYGANMKAQLPLELWEFTRYKGKQVAIPYKNDAGKYVMAVRQDWLDKLGLKVPTNLDELYTVADKIANGDPDGNGEKDTYAFSGMVDFMPIFCAYGVLDNRNYYIQDNKAYATNVSPSYKEALAYINKLWENKLIDPDFLVMQTDQRRQKMAQGKTGMLNDWWSLVPEILYNQLGFETLNPGASWTIMPAPKGPGGPMGDSGIQSSGDYQNATWLSATTKYPAEAIQFLDFLISDEGYELTYFGIKGTHYTSIEEGRLPEGQAGFEEKWLDSFNQICGRRTDIGEYMRSLPTEDLKIKRSNEYIEAGLSYPRYLNAFFGLPATDADMTYGSDLATLEEENRAAFITGERSLDEFDAYVQEWKDRGGLEILDEQVAQYNELRGASIENGMK